MKSYVFPVVIEPDEDVRRAYVPELEPKGAATWGHSKRRRSRTSNYSERRCRKPIPDLAITATCRPKDRMRRISPWTF
jgi:hypothetical protein